LSRVLSLRPEALTEIREAAHWYAQHGLELDHEFFDELARVLAEIRDAPRRYPTVGYGIRKAVLRRFPYLVLFREEKDDGIVVIACFHGRRDPRHWMERS